MSSICLTENTEIRRVKRTVEHNSPFSNDMEKKNQILPVSLVTADEMRAYDTYTIQNIGIHTEVLMERAALALADECMLLLKDARKKPREAKALCVCGTGNNGGDGLACARLLADRGVEAKVLLVGNKEKLSEAAAYEYRILQAYGVPVVSFGEDGFPAEEYSVIVDALFGTGLSRKITGDYKQVIETINDLPGKVVAADIPSGIDSDTGKIWGTAIMADRTVTFGFAKRGLYLYPGASYAGKVRTADIGITEKSFRTGEPGMYTLTGDGLSLFQNRRPDGNKGTFGKILIAAGSKNMAGAAVLCAKSAYRAGVGMVKLVIPKCIRETVLMSLPEAMIFSYEKEDGLSEAEREELKKSMDWADVLLAGPGLGEGEAARTLTELFLRNREKKLLLDADALNALSREEALYKLAAQRGGNLVLTPHMGELARLLHVPVSEVKEDELAATRKLQADIHAVIAGKSARTYVCDGSHKIFLNTAGNDRMATAGSGDVLSGMTGAMLAGGLSPYEAAVAGVYLHACAGDAAAKREMGMGLCATDLLRE